MMKEINNIIGIFNLELVDKFNYHLLKYELNSTKKALDELKEKDIKREQFESKYPTIKAIWKYQMGVPKQPNLHVRRDIRTYIYPDDYVIKEEIARMVLEYNLQNDWERLSNDEKAKYWGKWVIEKFKYEYDKKLYPEFIDVWAHPALTIALRKGDCEDTSLLTVSGWLNMGIPAYKCRVNIGFYDTTGHAWATYIDDNGNELLYETTKTKFSEPKLYSSNLHYRRQIFFNHEKVWKTGEITFE